MPTFDDALKAPKNSQKKRQKLIKFRDRRKVEENKLVKITLMTKANNAEMEATNDKVVKIQDKI